MNGIQDKAAVQSTEGRNRNLFLTVPSRIILNKEGAAFFLGHKRTLHRFETADGVRRFGFQPEKTGFAWLKKLLIRGYVEKLEIQIKDVTLRRQQLEDGIKMVFFSMLRRRINISAMEYIYDSPMVRAWNRANPKKSIGPGVKVAEKSIRELLQNRTVIEDLKDGLGRDIKQKLSGAAWEFREDNRELRNFLRELIEELNPLVFFVLAGSGGDERLHLMRNISARIMGFIANLDILHLASLLAVELVAAAERSSLVRVLEEKRIRDIRSVLESPERRKAIMEEKRYRGSTVVVSVPTGAVSESRRLRFRLSVHNDGADAEAERKLMEDFTERSYRFNEGQHLVDFFKSPQSSRGPGVYEDRGLCFYYLTILQGQCRKNNILLDANINKSLSGDSVVTTLRFGF
jgi:hypothetical protein